MNDKKVIAKKPLTNLYELIINATNATKKSLMEGSVDHVCTSSLSNLTKRYMKTRYGHSFFGALYNIEKMYQLMQHLFENKYYI